MNETTETRLSEQPSWLELPEPEKLRHTYWSCRGDDLPGKRRWFSKARIEPGWRNIFHSKEEAEAHASTPHDRWRWNGEEASPTTLQSSLYRARAKGDYGVAIKGYQNGQWVALKQYPTCVPLDPESA